MGNSLLQLIALAAVAIYLIVRLRNTLGTRDGFENSQKRSPHVPRNVTPIRPEPEEPAIDYEIRQFAEEDSETAEALAAMKQAEPGFSIEEFVTGAKAAYEMILIGFAKGEIEDLEPFLSDDVLDSFEETLSYRESENRNFEAKLVRLREVKLLSAEFGAGDGSAEIEMSFDSDVISYVTDEDGNVVEGDSEKARRQKDLWIFARRMGSHNPNWQLVATGG